MEDTLALGLVSALLFVAFYLLGKRMAPGRASPDDGEEADEEDTGGRAFGVQGRQLMVAGIVAGFASVGAQALLTAKLRPAATVFVQDPPF
jgi:hypothetical protein